MIWAPMKTEDGIAIRLHAWRAENACRPMCNCAPGEPGPEAVAPRCPMCEARLAKEARFVEEDRTPGRGWWREHRPLTGPQKHLLAWIREQPEPVTQVQVAQHTGKPAYHRLYALEIRGLIEADRRLGPRGRRVTMWMAVS